MSLRSSLGAKGIVLTSAVQFAELVLKELERTGVSQTAFAKMCGLSSAALHNVLLRKGDCAIATMLPWANVLDVRIVLDGVDVVDTKQMCQLLDNRRLEMGVGVIRARLENSSSWQRIRMIAVSKQGDHITNIQFATASACAQYVGMQFRLHTKPKVSKRDTRLMALGIKPIVVSQLNTH